MDICTAVIKICKDNNWDHPQISTNGEGTANEVITWHDNNPHNISRQAIDDVIIQMKADYEAKKYQRDRKPLYGTWEQQLDLMYHSMDDWKAHCKAVRDKHPKP